MEFTIKRSNNKKDSLFFSGTKIGEGGSKIRTRNIFKQKSRKADISNRIVSYLKGDIDYQMLMCLKLRRDSFVNNYKLFYERFQFADGNRFKFS